MLTQEYLSNEVLFNRGKKRQISSIVSYSTITVTVIGEIGTSE